MPPGLDKTCGPGATHRDRDVRSRRCEKRYNVRGMGVALSHPPTMGVRNLFGNVHAGSAKHFLRPTTSQTQRAELTHRSGWRELPYKVARHRMAASVVGGRRLIPPVQAGPHTSQRKGASIRTDSSAHVLAARILGGANGGPPGIRCGRKAQMAAAAA